MKSIKLCLSAHRQPQPSQNLFTFRAARSQSQNCRVVKLIGDKQQNIEDMMANIQCVCGCKAYFKNIVELLMNKIYKLRDQRNQFKTQIKDLKEYIATLQKSKQKQSFLQSIGVNTEVKPLKNVFKEAGVNTQHIPLEDFTDQLQKLISTQTMRNSLARVQPQENFEGIFTTFQDQSQSNLLQQSPIFASKMNTQSSKIQFEQQYFFEEKALKQMDKNKRQQCCKTPETKQQSSKSVGKSNFNMYNLQKFIEKITCAKQIENYSGRVTNKLLF